MQRIVLVATVLVGSLAFAGGGHGGFHGGGGFRSGGGGGFRGGWGGGGNFHAARAPSYRSSYGGSYGWRAPIDTGAANTGATTGQMPTAYGPIEGPKAWSDAWRSLDLDNSLTPVKLVALKPEVHADTVKALAAGDASMWRTFAAAYGTDRLIAAIAEPDLATNKLKITLIGSDVVGAMTWRPTYRIDLADPNYAVELAGVVSLRVLEGRWKAVNVRGGGASPQASLPASPGLSAIAPPSGSLAASPAAGTGPLVIVVEFRGMSEWQDMSRKLAGMPGVDNLDVLGMSGRSARVSLSYPGGAERLAEALAGDGIAMRQSAQGWIIAAR